MFYKKTIENLQFLQKNTRDGKLGLQLYQKKLNTGILVKYFRVYYSVEPLWTAAFETFSNRYEAREGLAYELTSNYGTYSLLSKSKSNGLTNFWSMFHF